MTHHSADTLGRAIIELRKSDGHGRTPLTQTELAQKIGILPGTLSNIEQGRRHTTDDNLKKIAAVFSNTGSDKDRLLRRLRLLSFGQRYPEMHAELAALAAHHPEPQVEPDNLSFKDKPMTAPLPCYVQFHNLEEFLEEITAEKDRLEGHLRTSRKFTTGTMPITHVSVLATARSLHTIYRLDAQIGSVMEGDREREKKVKQRGEDILHKLEAWTNLHGLDCRAGVYTWDGAIAPGK